MGRIIGADGDIYDQDSGVWLGVVDAKGREQPVLLLDAEGRLAALGGPDGVTYEVAPIYSGRRGAKRGIEQVDFGSSDVTVGNNPLSGTTATIAQSGGKARVTAPASMAAGGVYGCYATPLFNDFSDGTMIYLDIDFPDQGNTMVFSLWFYDVTFAVKSATANVWVAGVSKPGHMVLAVPKTEFTLGGTFTSADWANIGQVGVLASKVGGTPVNVTERFDVYAIWSGWPAKAAVVLAMDDSNSNLPEIYSGTNNGGVGLPSYDIPLTMYAIPSQWGQVGSATLAQMQLAYAAGWDVALHGVQTLALVGSITWATGVATFTSLLENHGFSNGNSVVISGADPYALNGTKTVGGATATTFTYATAQSGSGTALGYIVCDKTVGGSVAAQLAIVANEKAIAQAAGLTRGNLHYAYPNGVWSPAVDAGLRAAGYLSTRSVARMSDTAVPTAISGTDGLHSSLLTAFTGVSAFSRPLSVIELNDSAPVTLAKVLAAVDLTIKAGGVLVIYGHSVVSVTQGFTNLEWLTTKWWPLVKALKQRQDNGLLDCLTITQAYDSVNSGSNT